MKRALILFLLSASALAGPGAHGPNGEHLDAPSVAPAGGLMRLPDGRVQVPKAAQRRWGLRTQMPAAADWPHSVALPAWVAADPNASGRVQSAQGGRVEAGVLPQPGQAVRAGQVLARVRPQAQPFEQANQQAQHAELRAQARLAAQRVQRLEALEATVPHKDLEAARAEAQALREREQAVGQSLSQLELLRAPVDGVVAMSTLQAGQLVSPDQVLVEIVDPRRLWIEARSADPALAGQVEAASLQGLPEAKLRFVGAARQLREGQLPLHFQLQGAQDLPLALGQPLTLLLQTKQRRRGYALPAEAVVRNAANETVLWIKSGAELFVPQPVRVEPLDAATVLVTQGLGAENRVVVQGANLLAQVR